MVESLVVIPEDKELLDGVKAVIKEAERGPKRQYEIRTYKEADYNSHADIAWFFLNGGKSLGISPAGHSDLRKFNSNTPILCLIDKGKIVAIAQITKFLKGRPASFGKTASGIYGTWRDPRPKDTISDARKE